MWLVWYQPHYDVKQFHLCHPDSWNMVPRVDLICISLSWLCHMWGECQRLPGSGVTFVPGQDGNRPGAAWRHNGGWLVWKENFWLPYPSPASLYPLLNFLMWLMGHRMHLGRGPTRSSCPVQQALGMRPSQPGESAHSSWQQAHSFLIPGKLTFHQMYLLVFWPVI